MRLLPVSLRIYSTVRFDPPGCTHSTNACQALRERAGLSQQQLANRIGAHEKPPRSDLLPKIEDVLGVEIVDLLNTNGGRLTVQRSARPPGKLQKLF